MAGTPWRTVRVFISSTFRDMQAERDHLVRSVFPRLREALLKRRIHLVDVDLRWGVTSEQDALEVCREIIDECRPRFVCLLGGRYGWIPPGKEHSITADEVRYGVLDRLGEKWYRYFYFRKDEATDSILEEAARESGYREFPIPEDIEAHGQARAEELARERVQKLADLKKAVRDAGLSPFIYSARWDADSHRLVGLEEFGNQVYADLLASIDDEFGSEEPEALDEFAEEDAAMEAFIEERVERYVVGSRQTVFDELTRLSQADGEPDTVTLIGPSGCGKSALLGKFSQDYARDNPDDLVITHFVGASAGSTDLRRTLRRLCHALAQAAGDEREIPQEVKELVPRFEELLGQAAQDRRAVLVIDALNQLDAADNSHSMYWLPRSLPPNVRVIVSSLEHPALEALRRRGQAVWEIALQPLADDDARLLIRGYLGRYHKHMTDRQIDALLAKPESGNPLYLLVALEELRTLDVSERVKQGKKQDETVEDAIKALADKVRPLFIWVLKRLESDAGFRDTTGHPIGPDLVRTFVSCLGVSRHGLSQMELAELIAPGDSPDSQGNVAALIRLLRPYLMHRGDLLDFYHTQLQEAVEAEYLDEEEERLTAHRQLAEYFCHRADPEGDGSWSKCIRGLTELPYHLAASRQGERLSALLSDIRYLDARSRICDIHALIQDYGLLLSQLPEAPARDYEGFLRKHAQRLTYYRGLLFTLIHREGSPATKVRANELVEKGLWKGAWLNVVPVWMPSGSETGATGFRIEVLSECEFDFSCATELCPERLLAFAVTQIGQVAIVDASSGRTLTATLSTRPLRPVRLSFSSSGDWAAVAYANGEGDVTRLRYAPSGDFLGQQELTTLNYLVPETESPVLEFVRTALWYQSPDRSITAFDAGVAEQDTKRLRRVAGNVVGELSGVVGADDFVLISLRQGDDTDLVAIDNAERTCSVTILNVDVSCLAEVSDGRVAVAYTDRRLAVHDASEGLRVICETHVEELPTCMASCGDTLIWISEIGTQHVWRVGDSGGPSDIESSGSRLLGARRLAQRPDGALAAVTSSSVICFKGVRTIRRSNQLQAVFLGRHRTCFAVDKRPSGLFLLDGAKKAEVFLAPLHDWSYLFAMDDQGRLIGARNLGQGFLLGEGSFAPRLVQEIPAWITDISVDPRGGFWMTDQWGAIYHIHPHGAFRKAGQIRFNGIGRSRIQSCPDLLIWSGKCLFQTANGNEPLDVLVFFRLDESHPAKADLIDYRSFAAADGLLTAVSYDPVRESVLTFWQNGDRHKQYAKVGSVQDFVLRRENEVELTGVNLDIDAAVFTQDSQGIYLLCGGGDLFILSADTLDVQSVLSGSIPITGMSPRTAEDGTIALIEGESRLLLCTPKGASHRLY